MSSRSTRSQFWRRSALGLFGVLATLVASSVANAQGDIAPPLPNVLLLVDTSGSMEFKTNSTPVTCNPGNTTATNERSRWINVVEVLTGSINGYTCESMDRTTTAFRDSPEYQLVASRAPYDFRYPIPFHRPLSGGATPCAAAPGTLPGTSPNTNPFLYPANAVKYHKYNSIATSCAMSQAGDGVLDAFGSRVRFGLMTFDTEVKAGTGFTSTGDYTGASAAPDPGQDGLYSYIVGTKTTGEPAGCTDAVPDQEVGSRNGAAPAWEGRMMNFGNPNDAERAYITQASRIQEILLATRPFGATPIAGMLHDAEDFLWNEASKDPGVVPAAAPAPFNDYGPYKDPYLKCNVPRRQSIILLTDGEPNLDLRPDCARTDPMNPGKCPFDLPEDITRRLARPTSAFPDRQPVTTNVVAFAFDLVAKDLANAPTTLVSCNTLVTPPVDQDPLPPPAQRRDLDAVCGSATALDKNYPLQACCNVWKIALLGDGDAYFVANANELRSAFTTILGRTVPTTSRTQPVFSGGGSVGGGSFRFFSGFEVGQLALWQGHLTRQRWTCAAGTPPTGPRVPTAQPISQAAGDDFAFNVNTFSTRGSRVFYSVAGLVGSNAQPGGETVRRGIVTDDGAGTLSPTSYTGNAATFAGAVPSLAMAIPLASYPAGAANADEARTKILEWLVGVNNTADKFHRCKNPTNCGLFGDIYHSTPVVVGAPSALLRDESYEKFAIAKKTRPIVLYTSTNDGFLHAFKVASNVSTDTIAGGKELWAFVPPAVLPNLYALYPYNHMNLLDGVPVVRDVVAVEASVPTDPPTVFQRTANDARGGNGTWRTVLVQSFGSDRGGYFAVDITNPLPDPLAPTNPDKGGPRFLWQLTREGTGSKEIFGRGGGTPAITTLFFDPAGGSNASEIPVAILPGGRGGTKVTGGSGCPPTARSFSSVSIDSRFTPRGKVNCYDFASNTEVGARSLTIVRLDTGQIIRTFRQSVSEVTSPLLQAKVTPTNLDSPIIGQPVPFPGDVGSVADRIIVGDQDGRLWKVNVAKTNPALWTMDLFFDLYPATVSAALTHDFDDGQPIATPPVLSVDERGRMTVNAATGDQDALGYSTGQTNYVYSFTEDADLTHTGSINKVNWLQSFSNGERAVGPLALFNANLYFATFLGATGGSVCALGTSKLWGMQYIQPNNTSDFKQGGLAALFTGSPPALPKVQFIDQGDTVISGVSVAQQPSCYDLTSDAVGDDLVGYQGLARISQINPGKFELVMHANQPSGGSGQDVNTKAVELQTPESQSRIASWASIVE